MKNKLKVNIYNRTYNLLSEESQEQFIERAREFYSEGKRNGVGAENARLSRAFPFRTPQC